MIENTSTHLHSQPGENGLELTREHIWSKVRTSVAVRTRLLAPDLSLHFRITVRSVDVRHDSLSSVVESFVSGSAVDWLAAAFPVTSDALRALSVGSSSFQKIFFMMRQQHPETCFSKSCFLWIKETNLHQSHREPEHFGELKG